MGRAIVIPVAEGIKHLKAPPELLGCIFNAIKQIIRDYNMQPGDGDSVIHKSLTQDLREIPEVKLINCSVIPVWDPPDGVPLKEILLVQLLQLLTAHKEGEGGLQVGFLHRGRLELDRWLPGHWGRHNHNGDLLRLNTKAVITHFYP